tara:strand:- start:52 stop:474 length:423 start_codon:yes stop_codon:yes gene_type:complete
MNILVLQGPNLNLLGLKSSQSKNHLTLDKLNKTIKKHIKNKDIKIKFLQTHKEYHAINFLQRNRNLAEGLLFIPTSWAKYNFTILETINLINIKTATVYFDASYNFGTDIKNSIVKAKNITSFTGNPVGACIEGLNHLIN